MYCSLRSGLYALGRGVLALAFGVSLVRMGMVLS